MAKQTILKKKGCVQWNMSRDLYDWLGGFANKLETDRTKIIRSFLIQLQTDDSALRGQVHDLIELGLKDPVLDPFVAKVELPVDVELWMRDFIKTVGLHPRYPKRKARLGSLLNGYIHFIKRNEDQCVKRWRLEVVQVA